MAETNKHYPEHCGTKVQPSGGVIHCLLKPQHSGTCKGFTVEA